MHANAARGMWTQTHDCMDAHTGSKSHTYKKKRERKKKDLAIHLPQLMSSGSTPVVLTHLGVVRLWH